MSSLSYSEKYYYWSARHVNISDQNQDVLDHPNVAGWPAYYQEPLFHEYWITSVTLPNRTSHIRYLLSNAGARASKDDTTVRIKSEPLELIETFEDPENFKNKVFINLKSNNELTVVTIEDDGGGYPNDIISKIGEPYLRSLKNKDKNQSGLGLGIFIGKNLLEKNFASLNLSLIHI